LRINIAIAGGPCTGKSTLAASLFARLKESGLDYDLVMEESRKLKKEFGYCRSPFERFYLWRQQNREEERSTATNGFVTDQPLFQLYVQARQYAQTKRDWLAVRELLRMSLEIRKRYHLIVIAKDPEEILYKTDQGRASSRAIALERHALLRTFIEHFWPEKAVPVSGPVAERVQQVYAALIVKREKRKKNKKK